MFKASYRIATVFGIPIRLHISVIILLLMYVGRFSFPFNILIGVGILISIALHELGHSLVAKSKRCKVREITLWFMGGVAQMESIPRKPLDEFLMAVAGPAVSLVLGSGLAFIGSSFAFAPIPELIAYGWLINTLQYLGYANIFLALFNLIPAFPMDGGRVLRAGLTPLVGRLKATRIASGIGKLVAVGFVFLAFWLHAFEMIFLAVFLYYIANREYRMVLMQERGRPSSFWDWIQAAAGNRAKPEEEDDDQVIISPPPYERGPSSRSRISEERRGPFGPF